MMIDAIFDYVSWLVSNLQTRNQFLLTSVKIKNTCTNQIHSETVAQRNFPQFTGRHLCQGHFYHKVAGLRPETLFKKRLWNSCFPVNFSKFLRTPFLTQHLLWFLLFFCQGNVFWKVQKFTVYLYLEKLRTF